MDKSPRNCYEFSFYGADHVDYAGAQRSKSKLSNASNAAAAAPLEILPLKATSEWIDCFYSKDEDEAKHFENFAFSSLGNDYLPPSWSNGFVGTADAEQERLREQVQAYETLVASDLNNNLLEYDRAYVKASEGRFLTLPVSFVKKEPSIALKKEVRDSDEPFERELAALLSAVPTEVRGIDEAFERELAALLNSIPGYDSIDKSPIMEIVPENNDFCNTADLLPYEKIEEFLNSTPVLPPKPSLSHENNPQPLVKKKPKVALKRAIMCDALPMPVKKPRTKSVKAPETREERVEARFKGKMPKVKNPNREALKHLDVNIANSKIVRDERANQPRAEVRRKKPKYGEDLWEDRVPEEKKA